MIVCLLVSLFVFLMYFDDVGTHIGPEAFVWEGKTDVYVEPKAIVQNRTYGWVYAVFSLLCGWRGRAGWCFCWVSRGPGWNADLAGGREMLQCPAQSLLLQFGLSKSVGALVSNCTGALKLSFRNSLQILQRSQWCFWQVMSSAAGSYLPVKGMLLLLLLDAWSNSE